METEEGGGVQGDPRGDWRGTAVAVDMDGAMMWKDILSLILKVSEKQSVFEKTNDISRYRMDNWV